METEDENVKKKLKVNKLMIVILLIILLVILCIILIKVFHAKDGVNNNDSNLGLAIRSDDSVFYYNYDKGLIRKDKKEEKILSKDQAYSLNYFDGAIYYATPSSTGGISIKKVNVNGKDEKVLLSTNSNSTKIYLQDSKIYYLTSNPDTLSKIDLDGKNEEVIIQRSIMDFKVIEDKIYFSDIMGFLYSIDTNGENYKTIIEESLFNKFQILDKYVYYFDNENNKLMRINLENVAKKEEVTELLDCDTYNVTTNGIYYLNKEKGKIAYVALNGQKKSDIVNVDTDNTKINIVGTYIYYIDIQDGKTVTKVVETNGKGGIQK